LALTRLKREEADRLKESKEWEKKIAEEREIAQKEEPKGKATEKKPEDAEAVFTKESQAPILYRIEKEDVLGVSGMGHPELSKS